MKFAALKNEEGFSIVELIVAITLGAILATGVSSIVVSQSFLAQRSRALVIANSFAEGKMEGLRSTGFNGLSVGTTNLDAELPSDLPQPKSATLVITSPSVDVKRAVLTVSYNEQGTTRTYTYTTLIGELGVGQ